MAPTINVGIEHIFDVTKVPQGPKGLNIYLGVSKAIPSIENHIKHLEHLAPGDERRKAFSSFFRMLEEKLGMPLPEVAQAPLPVESRRKIGGSNRLFVYWRNRFGTAFFVVVDLHNDRIGVWDTQRAGTFLNIIA